MTRKPGARVQLDDVSKAIIEQLQQDGRRSYAAIGKVVGLSEAAVRQRVQRLIEGGVMQVVAVTDPLELGFARQAMVGIRVSGPLEPVADAIAELEEVDYVVITAGTYDLLVEVVCESDEHLLELISGQIRAHRGRRRHRDVHVPQAAQADLLVGRPLNRRTDPHWERLSLWHDTVDTDWTPRPALVGDVDADVAIVGAGFTGLWTAYYLAEADPTLRIVVLEAETAGFGASGRNGGWCSALFPASLGTLAGLADRDGALAQHRAMRETVDEVIAVAAAEGIDADIAKGGTIALARSRAQLRRARAEVADARSWDRGEDDLRLLGPQGGRRRSCAAPAPCGATYTPDCAAIHPARLVRGLAEAVERRGVTIHERSPVRAIEPGRAHTANGDVRAATVLRATEGYTAEPARPATGRWCRSTR